MDLRAAAPRWVGIPILNIQWGSGPLPFFSPDLNKNIYSTEAYPHPSTPSLPFPRQTASHAYGASCLLVHNINVFGALGGFRLLRDRLYACFEGAGTTSDEDDNDGDNEDNAPLEPPPPPSQSRSSSSSTTIGASSSGSGSGYQLQRLPTLAVLRLHFTAIHALRARLEPAPLLEAVFHLKESLPALLLALEDGQLKQVANADVREIPAMLQVS